MKILYYLTLLSTIFISGCAQRTQSWVNIHGGDPSLYGVRVQQTPDCCGEEGRYRHRHPAMIIYVFNDGRAHQMGFTPDGIVDEDFWWKLDSGHYLWNSTDLIRVSDAEAQAAKSGFNYEDLRLRATSDLARVPPFIAMGAHLDGAGTEQFASDLSDLLHSHGDEAFAEMLINLPQAERTTALASLRYDSGIDQDEKFAKKFRKKYPQYEALIEAQSDK